jgi:hypothetical protein
MGAGSRTEGGHLATLISALKAREAEKCRRSSELGRLDTWVRTDRSDLTVMARDLRRRVLEWREMAARNVSQARQILRKLLAGRIVLAPRTDRKCELSGRADYGTLFSGIPLAMSFLRDR